MERTELAKMLSIHDQTLYKYESGQRLIPLELLYKIAKIVNKPFNWFLGENEDDKEIQERLARALNMSIGDIIKTKKVPIIGEVIAGPPMLAIENIDDYVNVSTDVNADFALKVTGDSMEPFLKKDDIVVCRQADCAEPGDMVVVLPNGDDATVKYLMKDELGHYFLRAANPNYRDIPIQDPRAKVVGVVTQVIKKPEPYTSLPADSRELAELGFSNDDIMNDPLIKDTLKLVGRAHQELSKSAKEDMAKMIKMWVENLIGKNQQIEGGKEKAVSQPPPAQGRGLADD